MTQQTQSPSGFLGRGPFFWLGLTLASMTVIVALSLSDAIENKTAIMILMIAPLFTIFGIFKAMLNANAAGDGTCVQQGLAQRRYIKRVAMFTSLYLATFAALTFVDNVEGVPTAARYVIAALPGFAVIGIFWAIGRLIVEETDEFIRMLTVRQTLIASALAMSAASIWGFLETADLVPHIDAYWYAVVWFAGLFLGALVNRIEHGTWGAA